MGKMPNSDWGCAINAAQLQITFSKAIDETTVIDTTAAGVKTLKTSVVGISKISESGTVAELTSAPASLSADGKTLTITAFSGSFSGYKYVITVANTVTTVAGQKSPAFVSNVMETPDTTAPKLVSSVNKDASKVRVTFSEPLSNQGSWSFAYADGSDASSVVTPDYNIAKGYVDVAIGEVTAGKVITATVIGARDFAGNLVNPNPVTVNLVKGQLDGVAPTVVSTTTTGFSTVTVKFSEEVQGLITTNILVSSATVTDVGQDTTDPTKYTITVSGISSALIATVSIAAESGITDLSGEAFGSYSKVVSFSADEVAPTLTSTSIQKDINGFEYLYLTFSEAVTPNTLTSLDATEVKNYVTTSSTINLGAAIAVDSTNKQYKFKLASALFPTAALDTNGVFTVALTGAFKDGTNNPLGTASFTFTRGTDALTASQSVVDVTQIADKPGKVLVTFAEPVDGATATNVANYNINGVVVQKAEVLSTSEDTVTLTLAGNTNTLTGYRNVTVSGVKTTDGVVMDSAYTGTIVDLLENMAPTVTAKLTGASTIVLTFNEAVKASTVSVGVVDDKDFDIYIDGIKVSQTAITGSAITAAATGITITLTLATPLTTAADLAKTITIQSSAINDVIDAVGNSQASTTVTVAK